MVTDNYELVGSIRRNLADIAANYDEALDPVRRAAGSFVTGSREKPMPVAEHVLELRDEVRRDMTYWARFILDEAKGADGGPLQRGPESVEVVDLVPFVAHWVDWLLTERPDDAENLATEAKSHADSLRAIVFPIGRDWMPLGECPVTVARDGNPEPCGGQVRAYDRTAQSSVAWSSDPEAQARETPKRIQFIKCPDCGTEDTLAWWMSQIAPEGSDLAVADTVIACVTSRTFRPLTHEQLRQWATRGFVQRHGKDLKGRTLYSTAAVLNYAQDQTKEEVA